MSTIKDSKLAELGNEEVTWAARQMLVLEEIKLYSDQLIFGKSLLQILLDTLFEKLYRLYLF